MSKLSTISLTDELRSKIDKYNKSNSEKIEISKLSRWVIKLFLNSEGKFNDKKFDDIVQKLKNDVEEYRENNGENESKELLKATIENLQEFLDLLGIKYTFENEEMSRKNRHSTKYWYDKGIILQTQNRIEEALVAYNHAIEIDPNNEYAWYNKGRVFEELKEFDDAVDAYIQVSKINPNNPDAWFSQGFIDFCEYQAYSSTINVLNRALKILPNHVPSLYYKGLALSELNQIEEAIDCYAKIIDIEPEFIPAEINMKRLLNEIYQMSDALEKLENLLESFPDNIIILTFKGRYFYHKEENYKKALNVFDRIIKLDEKNEEARSYKLSIPHLINTMK